MTAPLSGNAASDPTPTPPPSPTPPTTTSGSVTPPETPVWRAGPNAPQWAANKTGDELLAQNIAMYGVLERFNQQNTVPQQPTQVSAQQGVGEIADDDFLTGRQAKDLLNRFQQQFSQPNPDVVNLAASASLGIIQQKYAKEFAKYGPEIQATLTQVPKTAWNLDNLERVVKFVRSEHISELAHEEAERMLAEMAPTMRSTGGAGSGLVPQTNNDRTLQSEKIDAGWRERAAKAGLTEQQLDDFCAKNDMTRDQFFRSFEGKVLSDAVVNLGR